MIITTNFEKGIFKAYTEPFPNSHIFVFLFHFK
ncbi:hypothetical protein MXB_3883 [Myxobolus squamalis]|nr:hypothetical protein MXB_3883 [Myxobolus squamalis]